MLNTGQKTALLSIKNWYRSPNLYMILDGAGGTGKSYLVNEVLKELPNVKPLVLAPTNEALKQLKDKVDGDYVFKTLHSALGITPTGDKELKFEQNILPSFWEQHNLAIVDEVSMVDNWLLDIVNDIGIKVLYIGHKSQLPPVKLRRLMSDKCESPVFDKGYKVVTLTEPMRNTGDLWDFNNYLEAMIYGTSRDIPNTFDISRANLNKLLTESVDDFLNDRTKIALWSNDGVDTYNQRVRLIIHGDKAKTNKYLPKDKIIVIAPVLPLQNMEKYNDKDLEKAMLGDLEFIYSNSKGTVISSELILVNLNKIMSIPCYKILVNIEGKNIFIYECANKGDKEKIANYYEHQAWLGKNRIAKEKLFKKRRFILSCFAEVKHFYSATSHRLQGSSVPNIIVINSDIAKNANMIEQKKTRYVACSRAIDNLYFYRGV
jgi:ATP-dependent exoDNAse (exonuclease V) alpha subunit